MSAKSLLQLILLLLIFLIIAGIYYLYFYSGPLKNQLIVDDNRGKTNAKITEEENNSDQEILEDVVILKEKNLIKTETSKDSKKDLLVNQTVNNKLNPKNEIKTNETKSAKLENIKNLTKEIEYITSNKNGDVFNILAKYGRTNIENKVLDLKKLMGHIPNFKIKNLYYIRSQSIITMIKIQILLQCNN